MIAPQYKALCIKEYIRDQEAAYYEHTMVFRATLKKLPDSKLRLFVGLVLNTRVVAKVMSIFKSQGVFQRDVEMERGQARDVASRVKPRNDTKLTRSGPNRLEGKRTQRASGP